ncbi:MAG: TraL conjugative transposon family protein [Prevotella sp.]|jgi:hypothetical protein|nr:TraL conjugative transposon family protein [Prevotella sp.]
MKRLRDKIKEFLISTRDEAGYRLRMLCGKPSPVKRLIIVLAIGGSLAAANIYFVASSIYNMGKSDAGKRFLELRHIEPPELLHKSDSIRSIRDYMLEFKNEGYEYE